MDNRILEIILRARDEATKTIEKASKGIAGSLKNAEDASKAFTASVIGLGVATAGIIGTSTLTAARTETLGVAMQAVAKATGTSTKLLAEQEKTLKNQGITTQEARKTLTLFMQSQLDVAQAAKIARVAQDLAVIAGEDSSATTGRLTEAIATMNPMLLRQVGIVRNSEEVFADYGKTIGKGGDKLTETEKKQAMVNLILAEGNKVAGTYEAAMDTAGKKLGSLSRYMEEAANTVGTFFLPAFGGVIDVVTELFKQVNEENVTAWLEWIRKYGPVVAGVIIGGMVPAMYAFALAVGASVIALAPFLIAGAAVGLLATVIMNNWAPISSFFTDVWRGITRTIGEAITWVSALGKYFGMVIDEGDPLNDWLTHLPVPMRGVVQGIGEMIVWFQNLPAAAGAGLERFRTDVSRTIESTVSWFQALPGRVDAYLTDLFLTRIPYAVGFALGYLSVAVPQMIDSVVLWFSTLPERVAASFEQMNIWVGQKLTALRDWLITMVPLIVNVLLFGLFSLPAAVDSIFAQMGRLMQDRLTTSGNAMGNELSAWPSRVGSFLATLPGIVAAVFQRTADAALFKLELLWNGVVSIWNKIKSVFDAITDAANRAWSAARKGFDAGRNVAGMRFADGGWVPYTGNAVVHAGEFVLSRDMLAGREPVPASVPVGKGGGVTINMGGVNVQSMADVDSMAYRLGFHLQTAGNL